MRKAHQKACPNVIVSFIVTIFLFILSMDMAMAVDETRISIGPFSMKVPEKWQEFAASDSRQLTQHYISQSRDIYRSYSGKADPAKSVKLRAFHIQDSSGIFVIVSFSVPAQSNLVQVLQSEVDEKAKWGIKQGYLKKYLGLVPISGKQLSGFYIKTIGGKGELQITGALNHKNLSNNLVQLTLIAPKGWEEKQATSMLEKILASVKLNVINRRK